MISKNLSTGMSKYDPKYKAPAAAPLPVPAPEPEPEVRLPEAPRFGMQLGLNRSGGNVSRKSR